MEPIAVVTAFVGLLYIVGRGPLLVAPAAVSAFYRRRFATPRSIRILGVALMILVALPLIVTARMSEEGAASWLELFGWLSAAMMVGVIAAPGLGKDLFREFYSKSDATMRAFGALNLAIGVAFGWVALFVL